LNIAKKCDFCGEEISSDVRRCPYCGSLLGRKSGMAEDEEYMPYSINNNYFIPQEKEGIQISDQENRQDDSSGLHAGIPDPEILYKKEEWPQDHKVPASTTYRKPLGNGMKVFLTSLCITIPGFGQLIGIIMSIIFMSREDDEDRKSFGVALLIASIIFFLISFFSFFIAGVLITTMRGFSMP